MTGADWIPPHAYIPGHTPRHPEGLFDGLKDLGQGRLADSPAWHEGLRLLRAGYYWEAHEVLEPVWLAAPEPSPQRDVVQGVIQIANAALKWRMGKPKAAQRLRDIAQGLLDTAEDHGGLRAMNLSRTQLAVLWKCYENESSRGDAL